jgi:hypoxanthine phosphoribosyltransferase
MTELKVLISREQITKRVAELGAEITRDFAGQPVILRRRLEGLGDFSGRSGAAGESGRHFRFRRRLQLRQSPQPTQELKSGWDSTGEVKLTKDVDQSMKDKNVIVVEDILDTGLTLTVLKKLLLAHQPRSLKIAALLDKPSRRKLPLEGDYVGFTIPDEFVVGYGLDYAERYRNLADICVVPRE